MFYNFNSHLNSYNKPAQFVGHTIISGNTFGLNALQNQNWPYFINRLSEYSESSLKNPSSFGVSDRGEADVIYNTIGNFKIIKELHKNLYTTVGNNLNEYLHLPILEEEEIDKDLRLNEYKFLDFESNHNNMEVLI